MSSPQIVLTASSTEASEWRHSIWQQMLGRPCASRWNLSRIELSMRVAALQLVIRGYWSMIFSGQHSRIGKK
jgi:hypothetical protein